MVETRSNDTGGDVEGIVDLSIEETKQVQGAGRIPAHAPEWHSFRVGDPGLS